MPNAFTNLLRSTALLDIENPAIERLVSDRGWRALALRERIGAIYDFVRNEIAFGYNEADDLPASRVLADGYGQCNTKGTLLMGLLRAAGVPCRFHGFTIDKALQKGAITGMAYRLAPRQIIHSWVEVWFESRWVCLEGFILDADYLHSLQRRFPEAKRFCGFGAATPDLSAPAAEWRGLDTLLQTEGIVGDFGTFDDPYAFYSRHGGNLSGPKRWLFANLVRHWMNANVARIRAGRW